jgi:uncharacterized protein YcnI
MTLRTQKTQHTVGTLRSRLDAFRVSWRGVVLAALVAIAGVLLGSVATAQAHVEVTPATAAPGQFLVYTVTVPNERDDSATIEIDLSLPAGFALDAAEQKAGWTTVVHKRKDGTPDQVSWRGGKIPVATYATFSLQGRNPKSGKSLTWNAIQRYENATVVWAGPESSPNPASVVQLSGTATAGTATTPVTSAQRSDPVARSRAALALVLAGAALIIALALSLGRFIRRRDRALDGLASSGDLAPSAPAARSGRDGGGSAGASAGKSQSRAAAGKRGS